jgi:hypothetical protein
MKKPKLSRKRCSPLSDIYTPIDKTSKLQGKMNPPKCDELDYIHFLIAIQKIFTCTEAARCQPEGKAQLTTPLLVCCKDSHQENKGS